MNDPIFKGLYVITDERLQFKELIQRTKLILDAGIPVLQYRDKTTDQALRRNRALQLKELCGDYQTVFLINDDVRLARDIGAEGVHIGQEDMSVVEARQILGDKVIIGVSCYNRLEDAKTAAQFGVDYVAFGAFFSTQTKNKTVKAETKLLQQAKTELSVPVVAIGGINPDNGRELVQAGADMLAVISCVYENTDPREIVFQFKKLYQEQ